MVAENLVEISTHHAMSGLYLSPDMRFFGNYMLDDRLPVVVQTIIHSRQPSNGSYARFADCIYERYSDWRTQHPQMTRIDTFMAIYGLTETRMMIRVGLHAVVDVMVNLYLNTMKFPDLGFYPRVVPPPLRAMQVASPWNLTTAPFHRVFAVEPFVTWTARLRGQYDRLRRLLESGVSLANVVEYIPANLPPILPTPKLHECDEVRRAIKRAVKLHARVIGLDDMRTFLSGGILVIKGRHYNYHLYSAHSLLSGMTVQRTSRIAPAHLSVYNKNLHRLADVCLYFYDTSILDYLLNVRLYASNETTELEMLAAMHVMSATRAFYADPILPHLKGITDPAEAPLHFVSNIEQHQDHLTNQVAGSYQNTFLALANQTLQEIMHWPDSYYATLRNMARYRFDDIFKNENHAMLAALDEITLESVT